MITFSGTTDFQINEDTVVAIGKFDGVHRGHEKIFRTMLSYRSKGLKIAIFTFDTPPGSIISSADNSVLTTSIEKRLIFEDLGVDYLVEFPFYEKTAAISPEDFIDSILVDRMHAKAVVCGSDCRFGYKGRGNADLLKNYGKDSFETVVVDKVFYKGDVISSTRIRKLISEGAIEEANDMLVSPYSVYGIVVHGKRLGRELGMPTVNVIPSQDKLLPPSGVYYSRVRHMGVEYRSITNIGRKPTVSEGKEGYPIRGVETYLYNFNREIYGDSLLVSLYHFSRDEMKFSGLDELKARMQKDIHDGESWHSHNL